MLCMGSEAFIWQLEYVVMNRDVRLAGHEHASLCGGGVRVRGPHAGAHRGGGGDRRQVRGCSECVGVLTFTCFPWLKGYNHFLDGGVVETDEEI
jgi:hypothetical protein